MSTDDPSILSSLQRARQKKEKKGPEPPKRTSPLKKGGKPKGRSEKMRGIISALRPLYDAFLKDKEACEIKSPACTGHATVVHHTEGRAITKIMDQRTWMASCPSCNDWVEGNDGKARELGAKRSKHAKNQ